MFLGQAPSSERRKATGEGRDSTATSFMSVPKGLIPTSGVGFFTNRAGALPLSIFD